MTSQATAIVMAINDIKAAAIEAVKERIKA